MMYKLLILFVVLFASLGAETLKVSSALDSLHKFGYKSQHNKRLMIPNVVETIIISFEKDNSAMINEYLNKQKSQYLDSYNSIFIADISKMPSIITKLFALPKMKTYKHTIYLHNADQFAKFVPSKEGKATIVTFKDKEVQSISFIETIDELKLVLEK